MSFLAFGTFWFWLMAVIVFFAITALVEIDEGNGWGAFFVSFAFVALLYFFGSKEPIESMLSYVVNNPFPTLMIVGLFFLFGAAWSIAKWFFFLKAERKKQWEDHVEYNKHALEDRKREWKPNVPTARRNKSLILMWISWWPFSMVWTLLDNPLRKAFNAIYDNLEQTYDRMAERIMKSE